jgi:hypothetical protein
MGGLIFLLHISGKTMGFVLGKLRKRRRDGIRCGDARIFDCSDVVFFLFFIYFSSGTDGAEVYLNR